MNAGRQMKITFYRYKEEYDHFFGWNIEERQHE